MDASLNGAQSMNKNIFILVLFSWDFNYLKAGMKIDRHRASFDFLSFDWEKLYLIDCAIEEGDGENHQSLFYLVGVSSLLVKINDIHSRFSC